MCTGVYTMISNFSYVTLTVKNRIKLHQIIVSLIHLFSAKPIPPPHPSHPRKKNMNCYSEESFYARDKFRNFFFFFFFSQMTELLFL